MIFGVNNKAGSSTAASTLAISKSSEVKGRVLVVDDIAENREILSYYLTKAGYQVVTADDGFAAVEGLVGGAAMRRGVLPQQGFDLVLMDMSMPRVSGYEAVPRLRASGYRTPIVAVTAHSLAGDREKCLNAGCDEYVTKPVDPKRLVEVCDRMMEMGRLRKSA
ncbi:MAG: response regulator [Phycisphaerales bacterium]|nr:response regulator [Phycisphaerales bacterium]